MNKTIKKLLVTVPTLAVLGTIGLLAANQRSPKDIGVIDGKLAPCPDKPNCVSTQSAGKYRQSDPIAYDGDTAAAQARLISIINGMDRSTVVTQSADYLHIEFRSRLFRFVDDVEFYFDETNGVIHFRSAARMGHSDTGVNPKRMSAIRAAFNAAAPSAG